MASKSYELIQGVLAEIVDTPSKKRIQVLNGFGIPTDLVSGPRAQRDAFSNGEIVILDVKKDESGELGYYMQSSELKKFADSKDDKKVKDYIASFGAGSAVDSEDAEPEVELTDEEKKKWEDEKKKHLIKCPAVPKDTIEIEKSLWNQITGCVQLDKYPLVLGPKGCGKSIAAQAVAQALGMEYYGFNMGQAFKPKKMFVGGLAADAEKGTYFVPSEFYTAFTNKKPTLIFLDEITRVPAQAANYLMTILDRRQSYIYNEDEGERVLRGKDVRFIAAGNIGMQYTDTRTQDGAFMDRFIKIQLKYLPEAKEVAFLNKKFPYAEKADLEKLVRAANIVRKAEENQSISTSISTRQLEDIAAFLQAGFKYEHTQEIFLNNFVNGNIDERSEVRNLLQGAGL